MAGRARRQHADPGARGTALRSLGATSRLIAPPPRVCVSLALPVLQHRHAPRAHGDSHPHGGVRRRIRSRVASRTHGSQCARAARQRFSRLRRTRWWACSSDRSWAAQLRCGATRLSRVTEAIDVHRTRADAPRSRDPRQRSTSVVTKQRFRWWRIRGIVVPIVALFAVGTIWSMYDVVWPQYLAARGQDPFIIGLSVSLFALPILLLARAGGRLADRSDRRKLVTAGLCVVAACASDVSVPPDPGRDPDGGGDRGRCHRDSRAEPLCGHRRQHPRIAARPRHGDRRPVLFSGMAFGAAVLGSLYGVNAGLPFWCGSGILLGGAVVCATWLPGRPPGSAHTTQPAAFQILEREQA